jgi:hypothetical protein
MAKSKGKSAYQRRYERLRYRVQSWRRQSVALSRMSKPLLLLVVEIDDAVAIAYEQLTQHPDDQGILRSYIDLCGKRNEMLKALATRGPKKTKE